MENSLKFCLDFLNTVDSPWIQFQLEQGKESPDIQKLSIFKEALLSDKRVQNMINNCSSWPKPAIKRHNDAAHPLHQMHILLDLGLGSSDECIQPIITNIQTHQNQQGAYLSTLQIPVHFGGSGEPELTWLLCDFPLLLLFLLRTKQTDDPQVQKAVHLLKGSIDDNGWRCRGDLPKFRGPGRKNDFCPYATLISLKCFALLPETQHEEFIHNAIDAICYHWDHTTERKIYLFATGTHFKRLKYPLVWYDIVNVCHTLSLFEYARQQPAFQEMIQLIIEKQQPSGGFIPESIYTAYKDWSFGQKKLESPMLTLKISEILQNLTTRQ
ncbi:MAG: hypothetical protein K8R40_06435 [Anaerolineaceae bacterium]|nr:hypothetical protein [Anaerolineaceae bacterium]